MASLRLEDVQKSFNGVRVLGPFSFSVEPGEIVALTGPSGAGKTTTCRLVTGLDQPDEGEVHLGETLLTALAPRQRNVAHMFESYALYPHKNVADNVAFPLSAPGRTKLSRQEIARRVDEVLTIAEIAHLAGRLPGALSGGQKQRVALCRALVQDAAVYVMDEPLSHLDAKLRNALRGIVRRRQIEKAAPTLWATPDAMEALSIADRVAVIIDGRIEQFGAPETIYQAPATTTVARLIGDPAMNLFPGTLRAEAGSVLFEGPGFSVPLPDAALPADAAREVVLGVRPTGLQLADPGEGTIAARVYAWEPFGKYSIITAKVSDILFRIKTPSAARVEANAPISLTLDTDAVVLFDRATDRLLPRRAKREQTKELAL